MSAGSPGLSVVIPVYNEESVLPALFARLYPALDKLGCTYEILFVNDGSLDRSAALLREQFQKRPDVTRVAFPSVDGMSGYYAQQNSGKRNVSIDLNVPNARELGESPKVLATFQGSQIVGTTYTPPFPFFAGTQKNAHQVLAADYVTTEDGTGMVHIAPAFGEEDGGTVPGLEILGHVQELGDVAP